MPAGRGGDDGDWPGGVLGGVERVDAAETLRESEVAVDCDAVDTFCRLRGGAIVCLYSTQRCLEDAHCVWFTCPMP